MSALTDNTTSGAPDGVEKMKVTAANTKSVNHEKASKPISADDISANMPAKVGTPESVKIKAAANDEVEDGSEADPMKDKVTDENTTASTDKKRGSANGEDESPSKKQRTRAGNKKSADTVSIAGPAKKGRGRGNAGKNKVKEEVGSDSNEDADKDDKEVPVPVTPVKKGRGHAKATKNNGNEEPITPPKTPKAKAPKTSKAVAKRNESEDGDETDAAAEISANAQESAASPTVTKQGTPRKRAATAKVGKLIPISTSYETAIPADKMIVKFKEEGKSWNEIRQKWTEMTGQESKGSSLPNRYTRLIANFMQLTKGDDARLLNAEAKATADINAAIAQLNGEKWQKVMKLMEDDGTTQKYPTIFLQKEFEKLVASGMTVDNIASASASESADDAATAATTTNGDAAINEDIKKEEVADAEEMDEADVAGEQTGQDHEMDEAAAEAS